MDRRKGLLGVFAMKVHVQMQIHLFFAMHGQKWLDHGELQAVILVRSDSPVNLPSLTASNLSAVPSKKFSFVCCSA